MGSMYVIGHLVMIMLTNTNLEMKEYYRHISLGKMPKKYPFSFLAIKTFSTENDISMPGENTC